MLVEPGARLDARDTVRRDAARLGDASRQAIADSEIALTALRAANESTQGESRPGAARIPAASLRGDAQTREAGPWWPHPEWGAMDQAGASNRITPEKIVAAIRLVRTGSIYELGQVYERGMPLRGTRDSRCDSGTAIGPGAKSRHLSTTNFWRAEVGQVGTQFDGLGHIGV